MAEISSHIMIKSRNEVVSLCLKLASYERADVEDPHFSDNLDLMHEELDQAIRDYVINRGWIPVLNTVQDANLL